MKADSRISRIFILAFLLWLAASSAMPGANGLAAVQSSGNFTSQLPENLVLQGSPLTEVAIPSQQDLPPGDLPPGDMQTIFAQIQAEEYFVSWDEHTALPELPAAYQAPNRAGNFRTYFSGEGVVIVPRQVTDGEALPWRWGISLAGWGEPGDSQQLLAAQHLVIQQNRVESSRGALTAWYLNAENGLQQGFDLLAGPQSDRLQIELSIATNLQAEWNSPESGVVFRSPDGVGGLRLGLPKAMGADGATLPVRLDWSGATLRLLVDSSQAIYPLRVTLNITDLGSSPAWQLPGLAFSLWEHVQVATAGDVNGDGFSDLIIGAPYYDSGAKPDQGAVWIYAGGTNLSSLSQLFYRLGGQESALFGYSVSTAGDVNGDGYADVIVGAPYWDGEDLQTNEGAVWIFHGSSTGIDTTPERYIQGGQPNANFGNSVAFAGDINRDNYADVIVGAPGYTNTTVYGQGKVFVYHGSASGIGASPNWVAVNTGARALLGWSVASAGDVNGDRYADVIVGAPDFTDDDEHAGRAFVWHGSINGVNNDTDGTPDNAVWFYGGVVEDFQMGWSVSSAGDIDGDGYSDVILGYPYASWEIDQQGQFHITRGSSTGLLGSADSWVRGQSAYNLMGYSVACAGDVNGDGYGDVIAGEPGIDGTYSNEGRAYVYYGHASGVSASSDWNAWGGDDGVRFGSMVATAGDINGDGYSEVIIAATPADEHDLGFIHLYAGGPQATQEIASWNKASGLENSQFGFSVATAGDVNGDGYSDIIVGAPYYDDGQIDEGGVFMYAGSESGLQASGYYWKKTSDLDGARFGFSVSGAGDVDRDGYDDVIVGAPYWEQGAGGADEGGVSVYRGSSSGMISTPYWHKESDQAGALFGYSVAGAGDTNGDGYAEVIVGAPMMENSDTHIDEGMIYVYRGAATGIISTPYLSKDSDKAGAHYGASVASAGDTNRDGFADIIVGAPDYTSTFSAEGGAWVYLGKPDRIISTPDWYATGGQTSAHFGYAVASAGDVNGDGYSDVIVGAPDYDDGESGEGGVWVYHGSASGLLDASSWRREAGQSDAFYGFSVSTAGDVNGDGYADVVVGARGMTDDVADEGTARVFLGSSSGLGNVAWWGAGGELNSYYGYAVSTAGDVNGDGYDEIIVGAPRYGASTTTPPVDQGRIWVYYGGGGVGESLLPRQLNADDSPIAHQGMTSHQMFFALKLLGKSPFWAGSMGIHTEVNTLNNPLDGNGVEVWGAFTQTTFGSEKFAWYINMQAGSVYHWRARLRFNPTSQPYLPATRWLSLPYHGWNEADLHTLYWSNYLPVILQD